MKTFLKYNTGVKLYTEENLYACNNFVHDTAVRIRSLEEESYKCWSLNAYAMMNLTMK